MLCSSVVMIFWTSSSSWPVLLKTAVQAAVPKFMVFKLGLEQKEARGSHAPNWRNFHPGRLLVCFLGDIGRIVTSAERSSQGPELCVHDKVFLSLHLKEWPQTHQASILYTEPTERPPSEAEEAPPRPSVYRRTLRRLAAFWARPQDGERRGH